MQIQHKIKVFILRNHRDFSHGIHLFIRIHNLINEVLLLILFLKFFSLYKFNTDKDFKLIK